MACCCAGDGPSRGAAAGAADCTGQRAVHSCAANGAAGRADLATARAGLATSPSRCLPSHPHMCILRLRNVNVRGAHMMQRSYMTYKSRTFELLPRLPASRCTVSVCNVSKWLESSSHNTAERCNRYLETGTPSAAGVLGSNAGETAQPAEPDSVPAAPTAPPTGPGPTGQPAVTLPPERAKSLRPPSADAAEGPTAAAGHHTDTTNRSAAQLVFNNSGGNDSLNLCQTQQTGWWHKLLPGFQQGMAPCSFYYWLS